MKEVTDKVERYLREQFPKRKIVKLEKKASYDGEIWGTMGMIVMVYDEKDTVYYKIIKKK